MKGEVEGAPADVNTGPRGPEQFTEWGWVAWHCVLAGVGPAGCAATLTRR